MRERVLGPDHPDTRTSRSKLAAAYHAAGRLADAIPLYEQVLATLERLRGPDHLTTLGARSDLADAYRAAGRSRMRSLAWQVLAARERLLGPDHPDTLSSRDNLTASHQAAGRDDAKDLGRELVDDWVNDYVLSANPAAVAPATTQPIRPERCSNRSATRNSPGCRLTCRRAQSTWALRT